MSNRQSGNPSGKPSLKKRHMSVQASITRLFLITLIILTLVVGLSIYRIQYNHILTETEEDAVSALSLTKTSLSGITLSNEIPAGQYASIRMVLRTICQSLDMQYLSVYLPNVEDSSFFFFFCVANSDEDDARVRSLRAYGTVVTDEKIYPAEIDALNGDTQPKLWRMDNQNGNVLCWTVPIFDYRNKVCALITAECLVGSFDKHIVSSLISTVGLSILLLLISMVLEIFLLRKRIFIPLARISRQMYGFASGSSLRTEPLNINSGDEIQEIADSFEQMTADIQVYMSNQERTAEERAQVKAQLELARNIQYGMVPAAYHELGETCEVSALMRPAREVGGDFYDCFFRSDGKLCVIMADVSGKGITAALFMAMSKSILHELLSLGFGPAEALNRANDELCAQNPEGMFVTVFAMVLDIRTGEVVLANAGHNPPVLFGGQGSRVFQPAPGIALALFEDAGIENETLTLSAGEGLLLYTDGITEAVSSDHRFYGIERLTAFLETPYTSTQDLLADLLLSVDTFAEGVEQFDDMTLAAILFNGSLDSGFTQNKPSTIKEEVSTMQASGESRDDKLMNHTSADRGNGSVAAADRSNGSVAAADRGNGSVAAADRGNGSVAAAEHVQEFSGVLPVSLDAFDLLKEKLRTLTDSTKLGKIILAAEEAFVNIVQYSGAGTIEYVLQKNNQFLTLILSDDGVSFDPFCERPAKDFDDFDTGGMGISLIRQITEQARWERKAEKNRLTLVFSL